MSSPKSNGLYKDTVTSTVNLQDLLKSIPAFRLKEALIEHLATHGATQEAYAFLLNTAVDGKKVKVDAPSKVRKPKNE